tara:strand:+ start:1750 stop:2040 length:291 start_codon:yes stop_codon:yes gene_type:complete
MNKRIIYPTPEGGVAVLIPAIGSGLTLEQIAAKDVPYGIPYKIIDTVDIPNDRSFREAWAADIAEPDGVGADYGVGSPNDVVAWSEDGEPILREQA